MTRGITSNAFACLLCAELPVADGRFLYVPLTDLEGFEMMRKTSPLQTFQLLKPTPWCRSTDMANTMQINAEAGESWQGKVVMVADVAFLAVEMATEPPSRCDAAVCVSLTMSLASWMCRRQYLPLGLKEAKPNVRQVHPAGVVVSSRCCVCVSLWGADGRLTARCDSIIHSETAARIIHYQKTIRQTSNVSDSPSAPG